jgi:inhibitor of KinA sporulation pathway (predicted exonuclease)
MGQLSNCSILVVDLEATCANDGSIPPAAMEIIEIGAVWALQDGSVVDRFQSFVRPLQRPTLTSFCVTLTGIGQDSIDNAPLFPVAARMLREFADRNRGVGAVWTSWGDYDRKQFARDCARHAVDDPLQLPHENARRNFTIRQQVGTDVSLASACELAKIKLEGSYHRALDDAINTARLLPWILGARTLRESPPAGD